MNIHSSLSPSRISLIHFSLSPIAIEASRGSFNWLSCNHHPHPPQFTNSSSSSHMHNKNKLHNKKHHSPSQFKEEEKWRRRRKVKQNVPNSSDFLALQPSSFSSTFVRANLCFRGIPIFLISSQFCYHTPSSSLALRFCYESVHGIHLIYVLRYRVRGSNFGFRNMSWKLDRSKERFWLRMKLHFWLCD